MTDEEIRGRIARTIDEALDRRWDEIDELWMRDIRPFFGDAISDEDFIKRVATPLSMRLISIGIQAGILGVASAVPIFEKPFEFTVAPSGAVSIRFPAPSA